MFICSFTESTNIHCAYYVRCCFKNFVIAIFKKSGVYLVFIMVPCFYHGKRQTVKKIYSSSCGGEHRHALFNILSLMNHIYNSPNRFFLTD